MASLTTALREEILRVSARKTRELISKLRTDNLRLKRAMAEVKQRLAKVERTESRAPKAASLPPVTPEVAQAARAARFSSDAIRKLRAKLGVSQAELASLLDVSAQSVYLWEHKGGRLRLRASTRRALIMLRNSKKKEALQRLPA